MSDLTWVLPLRTETFTQFFSIFPLFASVSFYLTLIAIGYWLWNKKVSKDLAIMICLSTMLNCWLKVLFRVPRPNIEHLVTVQDIFSFPSGDVQVIATFWLAIAWYFKKTWLWIFSITLIVLVGMSRVYLGVHYPVDVMAGAIIGGLLVPTYYAIQKSKFWMRIQKRSLVLCVFFFAFIATYSLSIGNDMNLIISASSGLLSGVVLGTFLERKFCIYKPKYGLNSRIVVGVLGLATLIILRSTLMFFWRQNPLLLYAFIIYSIIGIHIIFVVPWLSGLLWRARNV